MQITCPVCKKKTTWEENPWRPFCSERCKLIDLGKWASEEYKIPWEEKEEEEKTKRKEEQKNDN
jgi:endogenous inhibitor of DNA gyrase (YacG/DUF329 family)